MLNRNKTTSQVSINLNQNKKTQYMKKLWKDIIKNYDLYLMLLPTLLYFLVFHYGTMYGVQIAFKDYMAGKGIWGSPWVGFEHFIRFFKSFYFWTLIKNTLGLSVYQLVVSFPMPIILALIINEAKDGMFKKIVQTVTYSPHFISTVVMVGMLIIFLSPDNGIINNIIKLFGGKAISFMTKPGYFKSIYVFSGIWQNAGWGTIIYLAALAGVSKELHEAAAIDGAGRFKRIWHVNIPGIMPTAIIMLIMDMGHIMGVGFEKAFLMQNALNISSSEIISTYVYKSGIQQGQYSFSTAVGLFNSVINLVLLLTVNKIAKKVSEVSLW